ncbi:MAG: hypothetical protein HXY42_06540 [Chloroflexi bacterium]|nr:hypothetical protein [Chloroflexota bacterium]
MESFLCAFGVIAALTLILFVYLLNTARKRNAPITSSLTGKKEFLPVYITLADKPDSIVRGMDRFVAEVQKTESAGDKWRWAPMLIFLGGLGLMTIDGFLFLLGYKSLVFTAGGLALWVTALIFARHLRKSDSKDFSPRYTDVKNLIRTLRDDIKPGGTFNGHLDLTGAMLSSKVARTSKDTQNRITEHFRDEWLTFKAKLYDGNILRVSAIRKSKKRKSYWKRSPISGKMKSKPEKYKGAAQFLKVRIAVNPDVYVVKPGSAFKIGATIGKYKIAQLNTDGGIIDAVADSPFDEVEAEHILGFLQAAYSLLQRKAS